MRFRAKTIPQLAAGLLASAMLAWAPLANAQGGSPITSQDRSVYSTLYAEKLSSVNRTRSTADDMTLAEEMMGLASSIPDDDVGVKCLVYTDVITLASNASDLALMKRSLGLLEQIWPGQDQVSSEELMQLASRAYRAVERTEREEQGEHYIDVLLLIANRYEDLKDPEQAIGVCRLASTVARSIGSAQLEPIDKKLERLTAENIMVKRIKMLELSVQKNPQNSPAARELVKLLITQQNDPVTAARYVASTDDEELIDLVHLCAKGIKQASAATAMRVGDWHLTLAEDERDAQALALLRETRNWYDQFFGLYRRDDALAKRVEEMDNLALLKIERLIEDNPELVRKDTDGWVSLIAPPFDPLALTRTTPEVSQNDDGEITIGRGDLIIPFDQGQAYEIRVTVTLREQTLEEKPTFVINLPTENNRYFVTTCFATGGVYSKIHAPEKSINFEKAPNRVGQKVEMVFQVAASNGQAAFAMLFEGKPISKKQGGIDRLSELNFDALQDLPEGTNQVIRIGCYQQITLHDVEYRKRR